MSHPTGLPGLEKTREACNLSRAQLADCAELSQAQIGNLERGTSDPTIKTLWALCGLLKCTPNDLLTPISDERAAEIASAFYLAKSREAAPTV